MFRARYHGPDGDRYEGPHLFAARVDAEHWLAEVHREIASGNWRPPHLPSLGEVQLRYLEPDQIRRWYSTVLSDDRPTQRKHACSLLRSILRDAEDEGLIERNPCRIRNAGRLRVELVTSSPPHRPN